MRNEGYRFVYVFSEEDAERLSARGHKLISGGGKAEGVYVFEAVPLSGKAVFDGIGKHVFSNELMFQI